MRLTEDSSTVTAIITPFLRDHLAYLRHLVGIKLAWLMILQDYYFNGAIAYIDDTVIYGSTVEGFLNVISRLWDIPMKIGPG